MKTMRQSANETPNFAYWGDSDDWFVAYGIHRDSDVLERANFEALRRMAESGELSEDDRAEYGDEYRIETASHWLVGYTKTLLINPHLDSETLASIEEAIGGMKDYPVIDEELWSELEYEEACETAENALYELGIDQEIRRDVAPYVVAYATEINPGTGEYPDWPSKEQQFWGYVNYRRSLRKTA